MTLTRARPLGLILVTCVAVAVAIAGIPAVGAADPRPGAPAVPYVFFRGANETSMSANERDVAAARRLRHGAERLLWFRDAGREFVVRDPATLERVAAIQKPVEAIGDAMSALGDQESVIGNAMGVLGERQGALGEAMAALVTQAHGDAGPPQRALEQQMAALDRQMAELRGQLAVLQQQMAALDAKLQAAQRAADAPRRALLEQAIATGVAQPAP